MKPQEIINQIDNSLTFEAASSSVSMGRGICKVVRDSEQFVLKWWERKYIEREAKALILGKGIAGIPQLIKLYDKPALLKSYTLGDVLESPNAKIFQSALEIVTKLHSRGIANLDLFADNLLIHKNKVALYNFDQAFFLHGKYNVSLDEFIELKATDLKMLRSNFEYE